MDLERIFEPINYELSEVGRLIKTHIDMVVNDPFIAGIQDELVDNLIGHLFRRPGKRLRPALVFLSARLVGDVIEDRKESLAMFAAAVEMLHSASLIHDDIIDNANQRRSEISLNTQYGNTLAVLSGDVLYSRFFSMLISLPKVEKNLKMELLQTFTGLTTNMCIGEIFQFKLRKNDLFPAEPDYLRILKNKTALLMAASCKSGAMLNGASREIAEACENFGLCFGMAYQLVDDFNDKDVSVGITFNLLEIAGNYIVEAKKSLDFADGEESRKMLDLLCDYVLSRRE